MNKTNETMLDKKVKFYENKRKKSDNVFLHNYKLNQESFMDDVLALWVRNMKQYNNVANLPRTMMREFKNAMIQTENNNSKEYQNPLDMIENAAFFLTINPPKEAYHEFEYEVSDIEKLHKYEIQEYSILMKLTEKDNVYHKDHYYDYINNPYYEPPFTTSMYKNMHKFYCQCKKKYKKEIDEFDFIMRSGVEEISGRVPDSIKGKLSSYGDSFGEYRRELNGLLYMKYGGLPCFSNQKFIDEYVASMIGPRPSVSKVNPVLSSIGEDILAKRDLDKIPYLKDYNNSINEAMDRLSKFYQKHFNEKKLPGCDKAMMPIIRYIISMNQLLYEKCLYQLDTIYYQWAYEYRVNNEWLNVGCEGLMQLESEDYIEDYIPSTVPISYKAAGKKVSYKLGNASYEIQQLKLYIQKACWLEGLESYVLMYAENYFQHIRYLIRLYDMTYKFPDNY